jgi:hypothetical protein
MLAHQKSYVKSNDADGKDDILFASLVLPPPQSHLFDQAVRRTGLVYDQATC